MESLAKPSKRLKESWQIYWIDTVKNITALVLLSTM
jgi:hypothetical protein